LMSTTSFTTVMGSVVRACLATRIYADPYRRDDVV
jgi:hypothetical protein